MRFLFLDYSSKNTTFRRQVLATVRLGFQRRPRCRRLVSVVNADERALCYDVVKKQKAFKLLKSLKNKNLIFYNFRMRKEVELHPSEVKEDQATSVKLSCLSRCDGSAVLMSRLGSCCVGVIGPVEAKETGMNSFCENIVFAAIT